MMEEDGYKAASNVEESIDRLYWNVTYSVLKLFL